MKAKVRMRRKANTSPFKYLDREGNYIKKSAYDELAAKGRSYSVLDAREWPHFKVTIDWHGEFDKDVPNEYCCFLQVNVANKVNGKWVTEPIPGNRKFANMSDAKDEFLKIAEMFAQSFGPAIAEVVDAVFQSDDLEDYGEPEVPKDVPRTNNKNSGAW